MCCIGSMGNTSCFITTYYTFYRYYRRYSGIIGKPIFYTIRSYMFHGTKKEQKKTALSSIRPPCLLCTWVWWDWYLQRHDTKKPKNHKPDPNKLKAAARLPFTCFFSVSEHDWTWHPPKQKGTWYNMKINQWIYPTWLWLTACHGIDGP